MSYSEKVLQHYENPQNVGTLDKNDLNVGTGMVGAPSCGDVMRLQIRVSEDGIIEDAKFKTYGCLTSNALINTPTKSKKISDLIIGEYVLSWNGEKIVNQKIKDILTHEVDIEDLLSITFERQSSRKNVKGGKFSLLCTKQHIFWNSNNTPIEAQDLISGNELYEITEFELRKLTNYRHRDTTKENNGSWMRKLNKTIDHSILPQNQSGYVYKNPEERTRKLKLAAAAKWNDAGYIENWKTGMSKIDRSLPTSIEKIYIDLFEEYNIGARYSAGKVWIQSDTGPVSPDFIVPGKKKCIEVYTKKMPIFMQDRSENSSYVTTRTQQLKSAGYDCLFLAVEDIDNAIAEVQNFIHNGMKILSVSPITHWNQLRGCERNGEKVIVYDLQLEEGSNVYFSKRVGSHNCGSAIASSSLVTEWVKGKSLNEALLIKNAHIASELSLPPIKIHCSILAEDAIKAAIDDYKGKDSARCSCK